MPNQLIPTTQRFEPACNQLEWTDSYRMLVRAIQIDYENIARFGSALSPGALISDALLTTDTCASDAGSPSRPAQIPVAKKGPL
jgi:hypothetical protein